MHNMRLSQEGCRNKYCSHDFLLETERVRKSPIRDMNIPSVDGILFAEKTLDARQMGQYGFDNTTIRKDSSNL